MSKELEAAPEQAQEEVPQEVAQEVAELVAEEAKDAPTEEVKDEAKEAPKPDKTVPLAALHEERKRRQELQAQLAHTAERQRVMEERFQQMQQHWQAANAPRAPDYDTDPLGHTKFELGQTQEQLKQIRERQERSEQERQAYAQQQQYYSAVAGEVSRAESEFSQEVPDYIDAVKHYKSSRIAQVMAIGYDQQTASQIVQNEAFQIADIALRNGRNPAEAAFEIAKAAGWSGKKQAKEGAQKIETLQKGVKASSSLGSGGTPTGKLTIDAVANMSPHEFDDFLKSNGWEKLIG